jgi:hypothetical protein
MPEYPLTDSDKKIFILERALEFTRYQLESNSDITTSSPEEIRDQLRANFNAIKELLEEDE